MLTKLAFQNFKSWRDTGEIRLAPITALFGSNSSGKTTSLLQMLLLLKQTAESSDRAQVLNLGDDRSVVDLGTFQEVLFDHELRAALRVNLGWTLPEILQIGDPTRRSGTLFQDRAINFATRIEWQSNSEPGFGRRARRRRRDAPEGAASPGASTSSRESAATRSGAGRAGRRSPRVGGRAN